MGLISFFVLAEVEIVGDQGYIMYGGRLEVEITHLLPTCIIRPTHSALTNLLLHLGLLHHLLLLHPESVNPSRGRVKAASQVTSTHNIGSFTLYSWHLLLLVQLLLLGKHARAGPPLNRVVVELRGVDP